MTKLRYHVAVWLFDLAAWLYPLSGRMIAQAHYVGDPAQFDTTNYQSADDLRILALLANQEVR